MAQKKNILAIIGSAGYGSANERLIDNFVFLTQDSFQVTVYKELKTLPHFDPDNSSVNPPEAIINLRKKIELANGLIICTPEYIFSIPSGLKNCIEWCVATTVFQNKPTGLITASASGQKAHEELQLIMKTVMASFTDDTTLLIQGIKGKIDAEGQIIDFKTEQTWLKFIDSFKRMMNRS